MKQFIECPECGAIELAVLDIETPFVHCCSKCNAVIDWEKQEPIKAISVRQPWAYLIVNGIKDIENRTWKLPEKYKGKRVLIHASSGGNGKKFKISLTDEQMKAAFGSISEQAINGRFDFGAIIGSVELVDCVINHPSIWAEKTEMGRCHPTPIIYNWILANPIMFERPVPCKGKLSFFIPKID